MLLRQEELRRLFDFIDCLYKYRGVSSMPMMSLSKAIRQAHHNSDAFRVRADISLLST